MIKDLVSSGKWRKLEKMGSNGKSLGHWGSEVVLLGPFASSCETPLSSYRRVIIKGAGLLPGDVTTGSDTCSCHC